MTQITLTHKSAAEYVANYFAAREVETPETYELIATLDGDDSTVRVIFRLDEGEYQFDVWIERLPNCAPFIYGEW